MREKYLKHMKDMKCMLAYLKFLGMFCLVVNHKHICRIDGSVLSYTSTLPHTQYLLFCWKASEKKFHLAVLGD